MKRNWQLCPHEQRTSRWTSLHVTLNRKGHISMSRFTFQKLGEPQRMLLMYDPATRTIGLQAVSSANNAAFHVSLRGFGRKIHALRLLEEFNIKVPQTLRFLTPEFDHDGVLLLDLNQTRPAVRGQNGRLPQED